MKKTTQLLVCTAAALCLLTACGKDKPASTHTTRPAATTAVTEEQTLSNRKVHISDITSYTGEAIDYLAAIESAENMEINRSMIYVDSSEVDIHTPGTYKAIYTFDYLGDTIMNSIKVTIKENPNPVTTAAPEETTPEETAEESASTETTETSDETTEATGETTEGTTASEPASEPSAETTQPTEEASSATSPAVQTPSELDTTAVKPLPDAQITLSNGKVVTIKCTTARYITETYTDESYFKEDGFTFLTSELKILFNTGEVQVVETVVTRVQPPEEPSSAASPQ